MKEKEKKQEEIKERIERKKNDLKVYLRVSPLLGLPENEKERVTNQILEDIHREMELLKSLK